MKLIIVRHGATEWNATERLQGNIDIPLSAVGHMQAQQLAQRLTGEPIDVIYASGLQRTQATAQPLVELKQLTLQIDERLNEFDWGIFKGIPRPERNAHPELGPLWQEVQKNLRTTTKHQGELFIDFERRVQTVLNDLVERHHHQTVVVFGHGAMKRMMFAHMTGQTYEKMSSKQWLNGSYSVIRYNGGQFIVEQEHITDHLEE